LRHASTYGGFVLIQMSGVPGSGKSTLARAIAEGGSFVVIDTDVLKSALLSSGVPLSDAGRATYATAVAFAEDLLRQGHGVVLDSPCRYQDLLDSGMAVAEAASVPYAFIELLADDAATLLTRLDRRIPRASQVASSATAAPGTTWEFGSAEATLRAWQRQLVRPPRDSLRLNAADAVSENAARAHAYVADLRAAATF
jgi:predicted kinase